MAKLTCIGSYTCSPAHSYQSERAQVTSCVSKLSLLFQSNTHSCFLAQQVLLFAAGLKRSATAKVLVADHHEGHWGQSHLVTDEVESSLLQPAVGGED